MHCLACASVRPSAAMGKVTALFLDTITEKSGHAMEEWR
jgi:hypothetical protein